MSAKHNRSLVATHSDEQMRNEVRSEPSAVAAVDPEHALAAASERFATVLRTVSVETARTGPREARRVRVNGGARQLWAAMYESDWRQYIGRIKAATIH
jgi:hypothetical protein